MLTNSLWSLILVLLLTLGYCYPTDNTSTITPSRYITDPQSLTSPDGIFKLGFFNPGNSTNRYVGIWYNKISVCTVVWVANNDKPISNSSSGVLKIAEDGNLVVSDELGNFFWSTNVVNITTNNTVARLLDTGNINLVQASDESVIWQSFDHPQDNHLPGMQIGIMETGKVLKVRSWKTQFDPSPGRFSSGIEFPNSPQMTIWNGSRTIWRSAPWNDMRSVGGFYIKRDTEKGALYITLVLDTTSSLLRFKLDPLGNGSILTWNERQNEWSSIFSSKKYDCDSYNKCGSFGSCNLVDSPTVCKCLRGYSPKYKDQWNKRIWSSGCVRNTNFPCQSSEKERDKFIKLDSMKVPDFHNRLDGPSNVNECEKECVKNCSCSAYAYEDGIGCMSWDGNLIDIKKVPPARGADLYIRLYHEEQDQTKNSKKMITTVTLVLAGTLIISLCSYFSWRWILGHRGKRRKDSENSLFHMDQNMLRDNQDIKKFKFEELEMATINFCEANKLGQGGFGQVYKGILSDGQEIAVKRLSKNSGQGLEEFENEAIVILKLQHRNLVRLLGCCIEGYENMLVYEYMPNRSLDFFIFDSTEQLLLDWKKRFRIIEGVCRGILYLHRDSRLRVIHRDLKASNVLLDEDLNPKISDFGMARIFGGNELQGNTSRVVGTHGYMSPEYAMEGRFSEKSDVFSFGVLLLEIISGRRNNSFYHMDAPLNIIGYAWKLWRENKLQSFVDRTLLSEPDLEVEILRCIHVGLLCVQDLVCDRPSMSAILSILTSKTLTLPAPKQPAIIQTKMPPDSSSSQQYKQRYSINNVTITEVCGR